MHQSIFGWTIGGTVNSPSSPAINLVYTQELPFLILVMGSEDFGSWRNHLKFSVLHQKGSKQLIILTAPIPVTLMAGIVSLPRKVQAITLGSPRDQVVRRLLQTERIRKRKGSWNQFRLNVKEYFVMDLFQRLI